jgi:hypothetical protein
MKTWLWNGEPVQEETLKDYYGYVYEVRNLATGRRYIGKKLLWNRKIRVKNGKRKRFLAESNWRDYWGSNKTLLEDVEKYGEENFIRTILRLCKSKGECNYWEAKIQFEKDVLLDDAFYNDLIRCRIHRSHVKKNNEVDNVG